MCEICEYNFFMQCSCGHVINCFVLCCLIHSKLPFSVNSFTNRQKQDCSLWVHILVSKLIQSQKINAKNSVVVAIDKFEL